MRYASMPVPYPPSAGAGRYKRREVGGVYKPHPEADDENGHQDLYCRDDLVELRAELYPDYQDDGYREDHEHRDVVVGEAA